MLSLFLLVFLLNSCYFYGLPKEKTPTRRHAKCQTDIQTVRILKRVQTFIGRGICLKMFDIHHNSTTFAKSYNIIWQWVGIYFF